MWLSLSETVASTLAPGLASRIGFSTSNGGIAARRFCSSASVARNRIHGCSQPSRVSASLLNSVNGNCDVGGPVEINRQHRRNHRFGVTAFPKCFRAAEHQKSTAALGDKPSQQKQLLVGKKLRFHPVQNHRVIFEQFLGGLRKSAAQFKLILGVQAHHDRLIVTRSLLVGCRAKAPEQRIAGFSGAAFEIKFRFAPRDAHQRDHLNLGVFLKRPVQEFVFPIGPSGDAQNPEFLLPTIHHEQ